MAEVPRRPIGSEFDKPREACGVFGVFAPGAAAAHMTWLGIQELQHRGQDAAGIGVVVPGGIIVEKDLGYVTEVFPHGARHLDEKMQGVGIALGHDRYGTIKTHDIEEKRRAAMPMLAPSERFALTHNGQFNNLEAYADTLGIAPEDYITDSECVTLMIDKVLSAKKSQDVTEALHAVLRQVSGAYSLVVADQERLIGVRDPNGLKPLCIGQLENGGFVLASESSALDIVDATLLREVEEGEMVVIDESGMQSQKLDVPVNPKLCAFEFVYIARPDSTIKGRNVHLARERMGMSLAEDYPADADMVIGVPDSGISTATGYAKQSGLPYELGITKSRYIHRTFLKENQLSRQEAVKLKLHPNRSVIAGQRLVVIDDSIIRGNTMRMLIDRLRKAGAKEVHLRIPCPPYRWPCFYGVDTADTDELLAPGRSVEEMREGLGADSLAFLDNARYQEAIALPLGSLCMACTTGDYPTEIPKHRQLPTVQT